MKRRSPLLLFDGYGIELEYMIVNRSSLDVLPVSDEVLHSVTGEYANDYEADNMGWSNELIGHVLELKNINPLPALTSLADSFSEQIKRINKILKPLNGRLMPSGMHPWMNPKREAALWKHRYHQIYKTYDSIFNCKRHGWANIQSTHINISFNGDSEFARLHAALRLVLPLIPALAASSPFVREKASGIQDTRLRYYSKNQKGIPAIMGRIIPENIDTAAEYREKILAQMYKSISPYDKDGTLQHEWLNSRGAIPRFQRNAMEIRVMDVQECPAADIAISGLVISALKALTDQKWCSHEEQRSWKLKPLVRIFRECISHADRAVLSDTRYLRMFGFPGKKTRALELWNHLFENSKAHDDLLDSSLSKSIMHIMEHGPLSRRILKAAGKNPTRNRLRDVYEKLSDCLSKGRMF